MCSSWTDLTRFVFHVERRKKDPIFCNVPLYRPVHSYRRFDGALCLHIDRPTVYDSEYNTLFRNVCNYLPIVTSQKTWTFISTAVITSNVESWIKLTLRSVLCIRQHRLS
jgi:hypothetical protein